MKRILPTWCKEVKKSMIDDDINVTELAERVGFSRNYVSGVVNGRVYAPEIAKVIGEDNSDFNGAPAGFSRISSGNERVLIEKDAMAIGRFQ